jgi:cytochrome c553
MFSRVGKDEERGEESKRERMVRLKDVQKDYKSGQMDRYGTKAEKKRKMKENVDTNHDVSHKRIEKNKSKRIKRHKPKANKQNNNSSF